MKKISFLIVLSFLLVNHIEAQQTKPKSFVLNGTFLNDFSGYLHMQYEDKNDSVLVVDNHFTFKGQLIKKTANVFFSKKGKGIISTTSKEFYLENTPIDITIAVEPKKYKGYDLTDFVVKSVKGTKTYPIQKDYEDFTNAHKNDIDWNQKLYKKIYEIISKNPENEFSENMLMALSWNENLDKKELQKAYAKLSKTDNTVGQLEFNLFPEKFINVGQSVYDFELPDENNVIFRTSDLKGKWFLVDFWASWCAPCRAQMPELSKIYNTHKNKNFEVVALSIDKDKTKWIDALKKENTGWINLIEQKEYSSKIVERYGVRAIPSNFLINPEGKIEAKDISMEELNTLLTNQKTN
ncbi:TlpA disulfide reductase family protein [uncultured Flavobacterium sp.]|uniref:TlpA disulfide reductase family protein n=1 Tax=uncultured Flavobacterium sp. TaxID=165435 RepID=UPI00292DDEE1|nr:TlpA disulfide reductase family protein [uncultured Flavobacterium sp.]